MAFAVIEVCLCAVLVVNGYSSDKRIETDLHLDAARSGTQADNGYQSDKRTRADSSASIRLSVLPAGHPLTTFVDPAPRFRKSELQNSEHQNHGESEQRKPKSLRLIVGTTL